MKISCKIHNLITRLRGMIILLFCFVASKGGHSLQQARHKRFVFMLLVFFIFCLLQGMGGYGDEHNLAENNRYYSAGINPLYSLGFVKCFVLFCFVFFFLRLRLL